MIYSFIRAAVFWVGIVISLLFYVPLLFISHFLPYRWSYPLVTGWPRFIVVWLRWTCGVRHVVEGLENLPDTPSVILSKHQSSWETLAYSGIFPMHSYVIKREIFWWPIFGWGMALLRPIAINRKASRDALNQVIRQGKDRLAGGLWVVIFPQGTRVAAGSYKAYSRGGAALAVAAGVTVVPVAHNSGDCWPRGSFFKKPGTIRICIGPRIPTEGRSASEVTRDAESWIEEKVERISVRNR